MRRLVTVLRDGDAEAAGRSPVPGLTDLPALVASVAAGGLTVEVRTEGALDAVPAGVSVAAYRVVQEALTNIVRHAGHTSARVFVRADSAEVTVRVENDAPSDPSVQVASAGGGHGTVGMRERVELYGGTLDSGPTAQGGWTVQARLPHVMDER
jgi:signal transduction histidine kinase